MTNEMTNIYIYFSFLNKKIFDEILSVPMYLQPVEFQKPIEVNRMCGEKL